MGQISPRPEMIYRIHSFRSDSAMVIPIIAKIERKRELFIESETREIDLEHIEHFGFIFEVGLKI